MRYKNIIILLSLVGILIALLLTVVQLILPIALQICTSSDCNLRVAAIFFLLQMSVVSLVGWLLLRWKKVPHALLIAIFSTIEIHAISLIAQYAGAGLGNLLLAGLAAIVCLGMFLLYNRWPVMLRYKITASTVLVICSSLLCSLLASYWAKLLIQSSLY